MYRFLVISKILSCLPQKILNLTTVLCLIKTKSRMYFQLFLKELHLGLNLLSFERHRSCNFCFKTNKRIGDLTLSLRSIDPTWLTKEERGFKAIKYVKCARLIKQMWSVSLNLRTSTSSVVGRCLCLQRTLKPPC